MKLVNTTVLRLFWVAAILLALSTGVFAQVAPVVSAEAAPPPMTPPPGVPNMVRLHYPNTDVDDI
jgi:hypothetical protein